jgi:hypothetical protein
MREQSRHRRGFIVMRPLPELGYTCVLNIYGSSSWKTSSHILFVSWFRQHRHYTVAVLKTIAYVSGGCNRLQVLYGLDRTTVGFTISKARTSFIEGCDQNKSFQKPKCTCERAYYPASCLLTIRLMSLPSTIGTLCSQGSYSRPIYHLIRQKVCVLFSKA